MRDGLAFALTFAVRAAGALSAVLLSFVVGRFFGADGLGQFTVFLGALGIGSILARRGRGMTLMREVAKGSSGEDAPNRTTLLFLACRQVFPGSVLMAIAGSVLLAVGLGGPMLPGGSIAFLVLLPAMTLLALASGYAMGSGRTWLFPVFETGGISFVTMILLLVFVTVGLAPGAGALPWAMIIAVLVLMAAAVALTRRDLGPGRAFGASPPKTSAASQDLARGARAFLVIALSTFLAQAGAFAVAGPFLDSADLGQIRAAERFALLVSFPVLAIDPYISPRIVRHFGAGERQRVTRLLRKAALASGAIAAPALVVLMVFPAQVLGLVGEEFVAAAPYLRAMAFGHFVHAMLGIFQPAVTMTGAERSAMAVAAVSLVVSLLLYPLASTLVGPAGFVAAYVFLLIARSLAHAMLASRQLRKLPPEQAT